MTDREKEKEKETEDAGTETAAPAEQAEERETPETGHKLKKELKKAEAEAAALKKALADAEKKAADSEESRLRIAAEYENYRRRTQKEREGLYADAYADAVKGLLPILDSLERGLAFSGSEENKKGLEMILRSASEALAKMGVSEIEAAGKPFDPGTMNAVMHVEDESLGESVVAQVLQKGYQIGDKVIRFAMVSVAN
ncbi:MAG: nucleotide exchange factor GrpE [Clostridia bacterium]|nr:nucleotide exchange factor GrpE [Clostridia bacterium]